MLQRLFKVLNCLQSSERQVKPLKENWLKKKRFYYWKDCMWLKTFLFVIRKCAIHFPKRKSIVENFCLVLLSYQLLVNTERLHHFFLARKCMIPLFHVKEHQMRSYIISPRCELLITCMFITLSEVVTEAWAKMSAIAHLKQGPEIHEFDRCAKWSWFVCGRGFH